MSAPPRPHPHVRSRFILSAILLTTVLAHGQQAHAFKLKSHVMIANQAAGQIHGPDAHAVMSFSALGSVSVHNPDVVRAVRNNMGAFRAGVLGPDVFPDLFAGQTWVHIDNGHKLGVASDLPFEQRVPFKQWRSIDYGMFLLKRAKAYDAEGETGRDKAVAFAYGYLAHMSGDGFAHSYVNEWTRSVFDITKGHTGALYGTFTEEIQHLAVEGFLDAHIPKMDAGSLQLDPPIGFLNKLFRDAHGRGHGLPSDTAAGAFGGLYFEKMLSARARMVALADKDMWDPTGIGDAISGFATLGTDIGNPVEDITSYFRQRYQIIDAALDGWTLLSGCVAQNLLLGANQGPSETLPEDACASVDFEQSAATKALFKGDLNAAGRVGQSDTKKDFGRTALNMAKQRAFVTAVVQRMFVFRPFEDIQSLAKIKAGIESCQEPLVKWDTCANACSNATKTCSKVARAVTCIGCPSRCKSVWEIARCTMPHCWPCFTNAVEWVADEVCDANVRAAMPACHVCQPNPVCQSLQKVLRAKEQVAKFQQKVMEKILQPLLEEMQRDLVEYYAGPYAKQMYDLYQVFEERRGRGGPAWFVNLAFLREDFQRDPKFLDEVITQMAKVGGIAVENGVSVAQAVESTYQKTRGSGTDVLGKIVSASSLDVLWRTTVDATVSMARDPNFDPSRDMENNNRFRALEQFSFLESGPTYQTRFSKFVALLNALGALTDMRGPTARALRASMGLENRASELNSPSTFFSPTSFEPVHNAIALTKVGFLGKSGLAALGTLGGLSLPSGQPFGFTPEAFTPFGYRPSSICSEMSHPLCDSIQSLDDPNHYGHGLAPGSSLVGATTHDGMRSVALMESQVDAQSPSGCEAGISDFLLSGTPRTVRALYDKIFLMPKRCAPDLTVELVPTLDGVPVVVAPGTFPRASIGQNINWEVRVRNIGRSSSMPSTVNLDINGNRVGQFTVPFLPPTGEHRFNGADFRIMAPVSVRATATVDPDKGIAELEESNNGATFTFHVH